MNSEIVSLDNSFDLAQIVANHFSKQIIFAQTQYFADGEIQVVLDKWERIKDKTIVLIQSTSYPVNDHVLEVAFLVQELKNAGAHQVIGIFPYFGYSRQEKSCKEGKPGPVYVIAKFFEKAGLDEVLVVDIHSEKLGGFFSIPFTNISTDELLIAHIKNYFSTLKDICLIAPDEGVSKRVEKIAKALGVKALTFSKERFAADKTRIVCKKGDCIGQTAIVIDDIFDTGGTAMNVCNELIKSGFEKLYGYFTHPVFSGNAVGLVETSPFEKVFVSNSIPLVAQSSKIEVYDISTLLINALKNKL